MATTDVIAPIVHLNGTSADSLLFALSNAYNDLEKAAESVRQCGPNGRDYYPQPGLMQRAESQHRRRLETIRDLQAEIEREMDLIQQQDYRNASADKRRDKDSG